MILGVRRCPFDPFHGETERTIPRSRPAVWTGWGGGWVKMASQGPGCTSAARKLGGRRLDPPSTPGDDLKQSGPFPKRSTSVIEAPAIVAGLDDVAMVGQAIKQSGGHLGASEHRGPLRKVEIGGNNY